MSEVPEVVWCQVGDTQAEPVSTKDCGCIAELKEAAKKKFELTAPIQYITIHLTADSPPMKGNFLLKNLRFTSFDSDDGAPGPVFVKVAQQEPWFISFLPKNMRIDTGILNLILLEFFSGTGSFFGPALRFQSHPSSSHTRNTKTLDPSPCLIPSGPSSRDPPQQNYSNGGLRGRTRA
jgi:hypothetical protein